jgi:hypothetical protein
MRRSALALSLVLVLPAALARAEDQTPPGCTVAGTNILQQQDQGEVQINCTGLSEAMGNQLVDIMTRILRDRLDPGMVLSKLDEVDKIPEEGVARTVDEGQKQLIIQTLNGKPAGKVTVTAHPAVEDSAEYAKAIALSLLQVGWQIEGQQIKRNAPAALDPVLGIAVVVRDRNTAPPTAVALKAALNKARIGAALVADPTMAADATLLWIGRRRVMATADPAK